MGLAYSEKLPFDFISQGQDYKEEIDISSPFLFQILTNSYTAKSECWQDKKKRQQRDQTKLSFENAHRIEKRKMGDLWICQKIKMKKNPGKHLWISVKT